MIMVESYVRGADLEKKGLKPWKKKYPGTSTRNVRGADLEKKGLKHKRNRDFSKSEQTSSRSRLREERIETAARSARASRGWQQTDRGADLEKKGLKLKRKSAFSFSC